MKQHPMKHFILNLIMAAAVVVLLAVAVAAREQSASKTAYADLAAQRQLQADQIQAIAEEPIRTEPPPMTKPDRPSAPAALPEAPAEPFPWIENPNAKWLAINPDFLGWIEVPGTGIEYPYVRSQDNEDYLTMDFNGQKSKSGTIFMDHRNLGGFKDPHLMLYGHNMKNGTMFHDLVKFHDLGFFQANREIIISDLYQTKTYRIFSVYEISATDYTLPSRFDQDQVLAYQAYIESLAERSMHPAGEPGLADQTLLTLVTCSYGVNNGRTIVHAVEITD